VSAGSSDGVERYEEGRVTRDRDDRDRDGITYIPLADLPTATDKARRDAPAIAVCDITD
jgi:hypothetical protein